MQRTSEAEAEPHPRSVLTGRGIGEIAASMDAEWQSNRTRAGFDLDSLPRAALEFVEPMHAKSSAELPAGGGWLYEVKFDGYRTLTLRTAEGVRLLSRRNNAQKDRFPAVAEAMQGAEHGTLFDGEVVALD